MPSIPSNDSFTVASEHTHANLNAPRQLLVVELDRSLELAACAVAIAKRLTPLSDKSDN
jgi:hypothetical protein